MVDIIISWPWRKEVYCQNYFSSECSCIQRLYYATAKALQPVCARRVAHALSPVSAPCIPMNLSHALGCVSVQLLHMLLKADETDTMCKAKHISCYQFLSTVEEVMAQSGF